MTWYESPTTWVFVAGLVAHGVINWYKTNTHDAAIKALQTEIDSLREWRAEARTQIKALMSDHLRDEGQG